MGEARRTLRLWLLAALLEKGADPVRAVRRERLQPVPRVRALSPAECRELAGPLAALRFLPRARPGSDVRRVFI